MEEHMQNFTDHSFHKIVILGAGFGGLGMGAQLKMAGIDDFIIIEKAADIGGVWRDNIYPGAACDVQAHLYCYSFFLHLRVSSLFAEQPEFMRYMRELIDEFDLQKHIVLDTEITAAIWNNQQKLWDFQLNDEQSISGQYFIPAWGQLNVPNLPKIRGLDHFTGSHFHSARWDYNIDLTGKNVASIGAAASAVQYVPKIAKEVKKLTIFQRSANWVIPRENAIFSEKEIENFVQNPQQFKESRQAIFENRELRFNALIQGADAQKENMKVSRDYLDATIQDRELHQKLIPTYEYGCKRILFTEAYYPTLNLPHVHLETTPIDAFYEEGIITKDGVKHPLDVVIFGTGFKSQAFHNNLNIIGLNQHSLSKKWADGASAYLGITVPDFPNMFLLYGPNTNLNHSSILLMLEAQQEYIIQAIKEMETEKMPAIVVKKEIYHDFNEQLQADLKKTAFATSCASWYKNSEGKIINNWSGSVRDYQKVVAVFKLADFTLS